MANINGANRYRFLAGSPDQRKALLYVAGRFMMVRIDYCAKRRAASATRQASWNLNMPQAKYLKVF